MKNVGVKLVSTVIAVMVLIGTMMTPAYADGYSPKTSFEDRFSAMLELYLEREDMEGAFTIDTMTMLETGDYLITVTLNQKAIEDLDDSVDSDSVRMYFIVDPTGGWTATIFYQTVDGETVTDSDYGDDIWYDLFDM